MWIILPIAVLFGVVVGLLARPKAAPSVESSLQGNRTAELMAFQDLHDIPGAGREEPYYHRYPRDS